MFIKDYSQENVYRIAASKGASLGGGYVHKEVVFMNPVSEQ